MDGPPLLPPAKLSAGSGGAWQQLRPVAQFLLRLQRHTPIALKMPGLGYLTDETLQSWGVA